MVHIKMRTNIPTHRALGKKAEQETGIHLGVCAGMCDVPARPNVPFTPVDHAGLGAACAEFVPLPAPSRQRRTYIKC